MRCECCGCEEFYVEVGFYFCCECQTQSQEIRTHEGEDEVAASLTTPTTQTASKSLSRAEKRKRRDQITTWECYNYIILGLVHELLELGAESNLKPVVRILWLRYLEKLEVFNRKRDKPPKLQAVNFKKDAAVIYGLPLKRKKIRSNSSKSGSTSTTISRRVRKKRILQADYLSQTTDDVSMGAETLSSLKSNETKKSKRLLSFNYYASRDVHKRMNRAHFYRHRRDHERTMKCHPTLHLPVSDTYLKMPYILSPLRIYAILYLGLLIVGDRIQLGDMLRFIKNGSLSFNNYQHFYPEEFEEKVLNLNERINKRLFRSFSLRQMAARIARWLGVAKYVRTPDLRALTKRYCIDLNLPQDVADCVIKIISRTTPKMALRLTKDQEMPAYESRVLAFIIFVLKLLYGLDGVSEYKFSEMAQANDDDHHFDPIAWLRYLSYRNALFERYIFTVAPSAAKHDLYLKFIQNHLQDDSDKISRNQCRYNFQQVLNRMMNKKSENIPRLEATLTPSRDTIRKIFVDNPDNLLDKILNHNFENDNLNLVLKRVGGVNGIAHCDWLKEEIWSKYDDFRTNQKNSKKLMTVQLVEKVDTSKNNDKQQPVDGASYRKKFYETNAKRFDDTTKRLILIHGEEKIEPDLPRPFETYWLRIKLNPTNSDVNEFIQEFPSNFRIVYETCQQMAHVSPKEFWHEFQTIELYMIYCARLDKRRFTLPTVENENLKRFLKKINW